MNNIGSDMPHNERKESGASRRFSIWEQHGQSLLLAIITTALLFTARTLYESYAVQSSLLAQVNALSTQASRLEGAVAAMQLLYVSRAEYSDVQARLRRVEELSHSDRPKP